MKVAGARRITNSGSRKVIGKFPSLKMNDTVWWESQIERDYIYLLEIDPAVKSYKSQPFKLTYLHAGKTRTYTPDFWVIRPQCQQVVEVKPESKVKDSSYLELWRHIIPLCRDMGMEFVVVTDVMIRKQPQLDNIKLLYKYARNPLSLQQIIECQRYFKYKEPTPLRVVLSELEPKGISLNNIFKLMYVGVISTDLMHKINMESLIQLSQLKSDIKTLITS